MLKTHFIRENLLLYPNSPILAKFLPLSLFKHCKNNDMVLYRCSMGNDPKPINQNKITSRRSSKITKKSFRLGRIYVNFFFIVSGSSSLDSIRKDRKFLVPSKISL